MGQVTPVRTTSGDRTSAETPPSTGVAETTSMVGVFFDGTRRHDQREFLHYHRDGAWQSLTWAESGERVRRVAYALVTEGVGPGDRVVLMSPNRVEWILSDLAIQAAGAITVPIYPSLTPAVARDITSDCGATYAIAEGEALAGKLKGAPALRGIARIDTDVQRWLDAPCPEHGCAEIERRLASIGREDLCTIVYTSGTTGRCKGVMLTNANLLDMTASTLQAFSIGSDDVLLSALPLSHVLERVNGVFMNVRAGSVIWLSRGLDHIGEDLAEVRPTIMIGVPRIFEKAHDRLIDRIAAEPAWRRTLFHWSLAASQRAVLAERPRAHWQGLRTLADRLVLASIRRRVTGGRLRFFSSGGAPLSEEIERFFWGLGIPILQGWGMTELTSAATSNTESLHRVGTVGPGLPGVRVRIADDGEILAGGPGVTPGYFGDPEATAAALAEGWLKTGDLGTIDRDGYLRITGRKKELIKTAGGKIVAPLPVESRLEEDRLIEWALLIGDERPFVTALIVPDWALMASRHGITGDPAELVGSEAARALVQVRVDEVNRDLAGFEQVKAFRLLPRPFTEAADELTPTSKLKRRVIHEHNHELIDEMYEAAAAARITARA